MNGAQVPAQTLDVSLIENSHVFWREAARNALDARGDVYRWQFAFLHLVQSIELSLKALLARKHPVFIYEKIEGVGPKSHTVNFVTALERLADPNLGGVTLSHGDKKAILKAADHRNQITHSGFSLNLKMAEIWFFEAYAVLARLQAQHLGFDPSKVIHDDLRLELTGIGVAVKEMVNQARTRIQEEGVIADCIIDCPDCGGSTFVFKETSGTCYACGRSENVDWCESCDKAFRESEIVRDESIAKYGYNYETTCGKCNLKIWCEIDTCREQNEWL